MRITGTPSNAAKAASILHHTWGVGTVQDAVALYDRLEHMPPAKFDAELEDASYWGIFEAYEQMDSARIWDNIHALARSIDTYREELQ